MGRHSQLEAISRAFVIGEAAQTPRQYAQIGADMQRVGHFPSEVPEITELGLIDGLDVERSANLAGEALCPSALDRGPQLLDRPSPATA